MKKNAPGAGPRPARATAWLALTLSALVSCSESDGASPQGAASGAGGASSTTASGGAQAGTGSAPGGTPAMQGGGSTIESGGTQAAGSVGSPAGSGGSTLAASGGGGAAGGGAPSAAGQSGQGGGAGATAVAYQPCPPKGTVCVILPLGDSITEGVKSQRRGGYRPPLFHLALQDKKSITFVGDSTPNGPDKVDNVTFPRANEGWGGYTIDQISGLVVGSMTKNKPHIITLMVGTNDVNSGRGNGAPSRLGTLIDKIVATNPDVLLVVAQITPTRKEATNTAAKTYNEALPAVIKTRADAGKHVVLVDMFGAFTKDASYMTSLLGDDLHPQDAGYEVMADVWYAPLKTILP